jgi:NAD(P)-dependent dehydrogenase (short-subunit alcohol dehydrogenase family)
MNRACLISGGGTGIGAACAVRFAAAGWSVAINNFLEETRHEAEQVAAACGDAFVVDGDVTRDEDCRAMAEAVRSRFGGLHGLINSAGTTRFVAHQDLEGLDSAEFHRIYDVNVVGTFQLTRACVSALRDGAGEEFTAGVVNLSSIAGIVGTGSSIAYAASKGAVSTLTLSLARALAPGIRVNAIAPGLVLEGLPSRVMSPEEYEPFAEGLTARAPLGRNSLPAEIAELAYYLIAEAPGMTGSIVPLDNGLWLNAG